MRQIAINIICYICFPLLFIYLALQFLPSIASNMVIAFFVFFWSYALIEYLKEVKLENKNDIIKHYDERKRDRVIANSIIILLSSIGVGFIGVGVIVGLLYLYAIIASIIEVALAIFS